MVYLRSKAPRDYAPRGYKIDERNPSFRRNKAEVQLRPANSDDLPFIFNSWLKEVRTEYPYNYIHEKTYHVKQNEFIKKTIENSLVIVACNEKNPLQIFGYICYQKIDDDIIFHMVYVKALFRNYDIGKQLIYEVFPEFGKKKSIITFLPKSFDRADLEKTLHLYKLYYDPFLAG